MEIHLPLILRRESGLLRIGTFPTQGKGAGRKVGGPSPRRTELLTEPEAAGDLCAGLSCSLIPRPQGAALATATTDCSVAARWVLSPQGIWAGLLGNCHPPPNQI